jgi:hypothetical protein
LEDVWRNATWSVIMKQKKLKMRNFEVKNNLPKRREKGV